MTARLLDGAATAKVIREEMRRAVESLSAKGRAPGLGVVLVGAEPASAVYVRNKTRACEDLGIHHEIARLAASSRTAEVARQVEAYNQRPEIHGILVQLPLPRHVEVGRVLSGVDPRKDVDGFHPENVGLLVQKRARFVPCTPAGIMELLAREGIELAGKRAVVVGRSDIVGKPMALLLLHADATVTVAHSRTPELADVTREADILVVAVGRAGVIGREHVKPGAVVIDVGMNRLQDPSLAPTLLAPERFHELAEKGHALVGDVRYPEVRELASAITPVPGGVGPLTIALLLRNTLQAAALEA